MSDVSRQYGRVANLIVGSNGQGVSIQTLRISFRCVKTVTPEPNELIIKIYNLSPQNEVYVKSLNDSEYTDVILNAGYKDSARVVFRGSIKRAFHYRQKTDMITQIEAGDGDKDFHNAFMNLTLAAGTTDTQLIAAAVKSFSNTTLGYTDITDKPRSRGHAIFGSTHQILSELAQKHNAHWSIQDGQLTIVGASSVLPNEAIVLNSETGLLETPQLTDRGIIVTSLMNPQFRCNGVVKLNNNDIKLKPKIKRAGVSSSRNTTTKAPVIRLDPDGLYKIIRIDMNCDTRGPKWTSELTCIGIGQPIPQQDSGGSSLEDN